MFFSLRIRSTNERIAPLIMSYTGIWHHRRIQQILSDVLWCLCEIDILNISGAAHFLLLWFSPCPKNLVYQRRSSYCWHVPLKESCVHLSSNQPFAVNEFVLRATHLTTCCSFAVQRSTSVLVHANQNTSVLYALFAMSELGAAMECFSR